MGNLLNAIIAILILVIVSAVCSTYFYKKGQEDGWELAQHLVPLEKGELYVCVENVDTNNVKFLTVQRLSEAVNNDKLDQKELRFRINLARDGVSLREYNLKYRGGN